MSSSKICIIHVLLTRPGAHRFVCFVFEKMCTEPSLCRVVGDEVRKLIVDPETKEKKEHWMDIFLRAKMNEADRSGYLRHELVHPTMKKWTRFERRWLVVDDGRLEIYKTASHATEGKFLSIIPLQFCTVLEDTKSKRPEAPNSFRINVTPNNQCGGLRKYVASPFCCYASMSCTAGAPNWLSPF